jgi:hypothetical protein
MINNYTNINKTNNHISPDLNEHNECPIYVMCVCLRILVSNTYGIKWRVSYKNQELPALRGRLGSAKVGSVLLISLVLYVLLCLSSSCVLRLNVASVSGLSNPSCSSGFL